MVKQNQELKLATYWQQQMSTYKGTNKLSTLTPREIGQVKGLFRKTGMISKRLIAFACQHWGQFTAEVISSTGFAACPAHPNIGYLLAHRDIAISIMVKLNLLSEEEVELALAAVQYLDLI
jgi:hypothetical protein